MSLPVPDEAYRKTLESSLLKFQDGSWNGSWNGESAAAGAAAARAPK